MRKGYLFGLPPLAWAFIIILIIILVISYVPEVQKTVFTMLGIYKGTVVANTTP